MNKIEQAPFTYENVKQALTLNVICGSIETGYRYWLGQFIMAPYNRQELNSVCERIRELWEHTTIPTCPCEKTRAELDEKIVTLAKHYITINNKLNEKQP